jgi:hypothetical protein
MDSVCKSGFINRVTQPTFLYNAFSIIFLCIFLLFIYIILRGKKKLWFKIIASTGTLIGGFFLWCIISIIVWLGFGFGDNPPSLGYHDLNAMIKLRCYQDHMYCPHTAEEVSMIAPVEVKNQLKNAQITYNYDTKTNIYTLIVRNNNYHYNNDRVIIFDPRLVYAKNYGYNIYAGRGLDFYDADITNNCDGTFSLTNPPPFPGPWKHIK